jgi:hypothetical protein
MGILGTKTAVGNGAGGLHIAMLHALHEIIGMIQMVQVLPPVCLLPESPPSSRDWQ